MELEAYGHSKISIHALREEGDSFRRYCFRLTYNFYPRPPRGGRPAFRDSSTIIKSISIHALREEGDLHFDVICKSFFAFLSTPSARRATAMIWQEWFRDQFLSTPSARRATADVVKQRVDFFISIHALREEGDLRLCWPELDPAGISIHALREEGDARCQASTTASKDFYPRPPRGGRRGWTKWASKSSNFYPRPPRGGRRNNAREAANFNAISIHALREEGDAGSQTPSGGTTSISIHALREEGDRMSSTTASVLR